MKNRILLVDFIRCVASFSVVLLHSAASLLYEYNNISALDWWIGNIYDSLVRNSVPLFFILSGYLLLGKQETIKDFFIKRIDKILTPFVVWSIIYIFWANYFFNGDLTFHSFYSLLLSPTFFHLWFFYVLIGLYLYVPILRIFVHYSPKKILYYYIALWFFAVSIIPLIEKTTHTNSIIDLKMISGYIGYLVIGYILRDIPINKQQFMQALVIAILCLLITIFGTFYLTVSDNGVFNSYFYDYLSPTVILNSVSSFILLKYLFESVIISDNQKKILEMISSASLGIYLIHPIILYALSEGWLGFSLDGSSASAIYAVPLTAVVTFGLSFAPVYFIQKIPFVRSCVP